MLDLKRTQAELHNAIVRLYVSSFASDGVAIMVRSLTQQNPNILLPLLCQGEVTISSLEILIPRPYLRILIRELQLWANCFEQGYFPIVSSVTLTPEEEQKYFSQYLNLLHSLAKFGVVHVEYATSDGQVKVEVTLCDDENAISSEDIVKSLYFGQEVRFMMLGDDTVRTGHIVMIYETYVDIEDPLTGLRYLTPAYALQPDSYLSEEANQKRENFKANFFKLGHVGGITQLAFNSDGKFILSGSKDGTLRYWDVHSGQCIRLFQGHTGSITCMVISKNDQQVLTGSDDGSLRLWCIGTSECLKKFDGHTCSVSSIDWNSDGTYVVSASYDLQTHLSTIQLSNIETGLCINTYNAIPGKVVGVRFKVDEQNFISVSTDQNMRLWSINDSVCRKVTDMGDHIYLGDAGQHMFFNQNENTYLYVRDRQAAKTSLKALDMSTGKLNGFLGNGFKARRRAPIWVHDHKVVIRDWMASTAEIWCADTGFCKQVFAGHRESVICASISADGHFLATGALDRQIRVWDIKTGECVYMLGPEVPPHYSKEPTYIKPAPRQVPA